MEPARPRAGELASLLSLNGLRAGRLHSQKNFARNRQLVRLGW